MALSMHQIFVQLLVTERIDLAKDFLITKVLQLITKVLTELRKQKTTLDNQPLAMSLLEQIKWTLFVLKDRETQQKFSPQMSLQCVENLAQIFRAFTPIKADVIDQFLPGLSSVATSVISGDIKATMKVRVATADMWQVVLRNTFDSFNARLVKSAQKDQDKKKKQMLSMNINQNSDIEDEEDEEFQKLAECFNHISLNLYRNTLEQAALLK